METPTRDTLPLATGGVLKEDDGSDVKGPFTAPAGEYVLQRYVKATSGTCTPDALPGLGVDQGVSLDYMIPEA